MTISSINSIFQIKINSIISSIKKFECDYGNFEYIVFIFLFIYFAVLFLSKPSWVEHRYGVAAVSKCLQKKYYNFFNMPYKIYFIILIC